MNTESQTGTMYLHILKNGVYYFCRPTPPNIKSHLHGQVIHPLSGKVYSYDSPKLIKISLSAYDEKTALKVFRPIADQVNTLYSQADAHLNARPKCEPSTTVTPIQLRQMGDQIYHNVLKRDDQVRIGETSPLAAVVIRVVGKRLCKDQLDVGENRTMQIIAERSAQDIEHRVLHGRLKSLDFHSFDSEILEGEVEVDAPTIKLLQAVATIANPRANKIRLKSRVSEPLKREITEPTKIPSDVDCILSENKVSLQKGSFERDQLALDTLRCKVAALRDVKRRRRGAPIRTPLRPPLLRPESSE